MSAEHIRRIHLCLVKALYIIFSVYFSFWTSTFHLMTPAGLQNFFLKVWQLDCQLDCMQPNLCLHKRHPASNKMWLAPGWHCSCSWITLPVWQTVNEISFLRYDCNSQTACSTGSKLEKQSSFCCELWPQSGRMTVWQVLRVYFASVLRGFSAKL